MLGQFLGAICPHYVICTVSRQTVRSQQTRPHEEAHIKFLVISPRPVAGYRETRWRGKIWSSKLACGSQRSGASRSGALLYRLVGSASEVGSRSWERALHTIHSPCHPNFDSSKALRIVQEHNFNNASDYRRLRAISLARLISQPSSKMIS